MCCCKYKPKKRAIRRNDYAWCTKWMLGHIIHVCEFIRRHNTRTMREHQHKFLLNKIVPCYNTIGIIFNPKPFYRKYLIFSRIFLIAFGCNKKKNRKITKFCSCILGMVNGSVCIRSQGTRTHSYTFPFRIINLLYVHVHTILL